MMGKVHTNILSFEENQWKYKLKGQWVAFAKTDAWSLYDVLGCDVWRRPTGKKKKYPGISLVKVAVAQTQDLCTVSIHGTGGGGEPLLAKPNRVQAPPHYGITQKWREPGTHPIP